MRITFLSPPPNLSGGERVVAIYAQKLAERGHEVQVVCAGYPGVTLRRGVRALVQGRGWPKPAQAEGSHYEQYGVNYRVLSHAGPIADGDVADADVVVATFWMTAHWVNNLSPSKGRKVYLIQHDEGSIYSGRPEAEVTYALSLAHIYVSEWIHQRIARRHPDRGGVVIRNAIEADVFNGGARVMPDRPRVGVMWSSGVTKGCDVAIEAIRVARDTVPELEFVGFGVKEPGVDVSGEFDVFLKQPSPEAMAELYRSCTAWLFPSRFEGFGLPILEAMAARTPVVGADTGAAAELVEGGGGILVPIEDADALAKGLVEVCRMSPDGWGTMSERAFEQANSYTWDDAADRLEEQLSQITSEAEHSTKCRDMPSR